jgi:hypothetical protein
MPQLACPVLWLPSCSETFPNVGTGALARPHLTAGGGYPHIQLVPKPPLGYPLGAKLQLGKLTQNNSIHDPRLFKQELIEDLRSPAGA